MEIPDELFNMMLQYLSETPEIKLMIALQNCKNSRQKDNEPEVGKVDTP